MKKVKIFDTTLRDGEQSPGVSLVPEEKLSIARQLERLKVDAIEAGFPISSPGDFKAVKMIAEELEEVEVTGLARCNQKDIDRAWDALKNGVNPRIHVFIATSPIHMEYKLQLTPEEVLEKAISSVKYATKYTSNIEFSPEDASRSEPQFLYKLLEKVIEAGAKVINIPDTVGYSVPEEFGELIKNIKENVSNIDQAELSVHCHNDLGLAVANSLAAVREGAEQVEVAVNGIGERAGNTALEELIMAFYTRQDFYDIDVVQDTTQIARLSKMVANLTGMHIQPNKAIVGENAFAHEAGIHQDGVIKERTTYEIMDAKTIGLEDNKLVLGKHSGRHAFRDFIENLDYELDEETFQEVFKKFKQLADKKKKITPVEIEALIDNQFHQKQSVYKLDYLSVSTGNNLIPTATIRLKKEEDMIQKAACSGDGPIDAIFQTINEVTGIKDIKLIEYKINAITEGKDALGEVITKTKIDGGTYIGHSSQTDITEASALAYLETINKYLSTR
ncbi:MAG: 2-isopropylmalate synthase [Halanaerobiales bacterium]